MSGRFIPYFPRLPLFSAQQPRCHCYTLVNNVRSASSKKSSSHKSVFIHKNMRLINQKKDYSGGSSRTPALTQVNRKVRTHNTLQLHLEEEIRNVGLHTNVGLGTCVASWVKPKTRPNSPSKSREYIYMK